MASKDDKRSNTAEKAKSGGKKHANPLVYFGTIIILVIVVIAFVLVPALGSGNEAQGSDLTFGYWKNKPIRFMPDSYFAGQIEQVKDYYSQQGLSEDNAQFLHFQVWRQAYDNTVIHTALLDSASEAGIIATPDFLAEQMAKHEYFVEDGTFSMRRYRETSTAVKASIRESIMESSVKSRYVSDLVPVFNKAEVDFIKTLGAEKRAISYVAFPLASYPDSERLAFAAANAALFRQIKLSRITLTGTLPEAEGVLGQLTSGELDFAAAAQAKSTDSAAAKGGLLDWRYAWDLKSDFEDANSVEELLALPQGSVSPVYKSSTGSWLIYRVEEAAQPGDPSSQTYLESVRSYIDRFEKGRVEDWAIAQAKAFGESFVPGSQLPEYATARGYTAKTTNAFPLNYGKLFDLGYFSLLGTIDANQYPELADAHTTISFLTDVFRRDIGSLSAPTVLGENVVVFQVAQISQAEETDLSMLETYYPYLLQESVQKEITDGILKDERFKDTFLETYLKNFSF